MSVAGAVRLLGWLVLGLLFAGPAAAEDLEQLREAIEGSRERVGAHEAQERDLLGRLEDVDARLEGLTRDVEVARAEATQARAEARRVGARSAEIALTLERTRKSLAARAVALYKQGEIGVVRVLFSSDSLGEMVLRWGSLRTMVRTDAALAVRFRDEYAAHAAMLVEAEAAALRSGESARELDRRSRQLGAERAHKARLVARVHADRVLERALLVELERAARTLEETISAFGAAKLAPKPSREFESDFADRRGGLPLPVKAPIRSRFGRVVDERFQTETFRRGTEFAAGAGDTVRAVASGVVRFRGWFRGYGKIVVIDHGSDYFSVSGHLAEIHVEAGDRVVTGDSVGLVGDTGSLAGPGLYFELRRGGKPLDPENWLSLGGEQARAYLLERSAEGVQLPATMARRSG